MGDDTDERTIDREETGSADGKSTDELLAETERLLENGPGPAPEAEPGRAEEATSEPSASENGGDRSTADGGVFRWLRRDDSGGDASQETSTTDAHSTGGGRSFRDRLTPDRYLSPKALAAVVLVLGAGLYGGGLAVPIGGIGHLLGLVAVAFVIGLLTRKRRYRELAIAGSAVGAVGSLLGMTVWLPTTVGVPEVGVTAAAGFLLTVLGYYLGRDLRDGVARDVG